MSYEYMLIHPDLDRAPIQTTTTTEVPSTVSHDSLPTLQKVGVILALASFLVYASRGFRKLVLSSATLQDQELGGDTLTYAGRNDIKITSEPTE